MTANDSRCFKRFKKLLLPSHISRYISKLDASELGSKEGSAEPEDVLSYTEQEEQLHRRKSPE